MAWGYGDRGFGRFRTSRILGDATAPDRPLNIARTLYGYGPIAAYSRLAGDLGLRFLGPAFGTKFLYFCPQQPGAPSALILDSLVAEWLRRHTALVLDPVPWNPVAYHSYLRTMQTWAALENVAPDQLEECIFRAQAKVKGNQWAC